MLVGLLVGKYYKVCEFNVIFEFNLDSLLGLIICKDMLEWVVLIFGNLIDNVIEVVIRVSDICIFKVCVMVDEISKILLFDVEDSGFGLGDDKDVVFIL